MILGDTTTTWERSTRCGSSACVEVARGGVVRVRDSRADASPVLEFEAADWRAFLALIGR